MPTGSKKGKKIAKPKKGTHGGYRPGAGRKPGYEVSRYIIKKMLWKAYLLAEGRGQDIEEVIVGMVYNSEDTMEKLAATKYIVDTTIMGRRYKVPWAKVK